MQVLYVTIAAASLLGSYPIILVGHSIELGLVLHSPVSGSSHWVITKTYSTEDMGIKSIGHSKIASKSPLTCCRSSEIYDCSSFLIVYLLELHVLLCDRLTTVNLCFLRRTLIFKAHPAPMAV